MIRLGYSDCVTCHVSPQGGGLLTPYGKGIDVAQSLRGGERTDATLRKLLFDVRTVAGYSAVDPASPDPITGTSVMRLMARSSFSLTDRLRTTYTVGIDSPSATRAIRSGRPGDWTSLVVSKALIEYRLKDGLQISAGREELPTGLGLPDPQGFARKQNDPGATAFPTQVKVFWWSRRLHVTPFVFGPGGDEDSDARQYGAGVTGGVDVWNQRAVLGMSTRTSRGSAFDRRSTGAFARVGFGRWGILAEHDLTSRMTTADGARAQYVAGYTQLFAAPREWLVTSLASEHMVTGGAGSKHVFRLAAGAQFRLTDHVTVLVSTRNESGSPHPSSRTYSVQLAMKTVQR
jgi:hypothetical protein